MAGPWLPRGCHALLATILLYFHVGRRDLQRGKEFLCQIERMDGPAATVVMANDHVQLCTSGRIGVQDQAWVMMYR